MKIIIFVFCLFGVLFADVNEAVIKKRFFFTATPAAFSPESWKLAHRAAKMIESADYEGKVVDRSNVAQVKIIAAGGVASVIYFDVAYKSYEGPSEKTVERRIFNALVAAAEQIGDIGGFSAIKDIDGRVVVWYPEMYGKKIIIGERISNKKGEELLKKETKDFMEGRLPNVLGPMQKGEPNKPTVEPAKSSGNHSEENAKHANAR